MTKEYDGIPRTVFTAEQLRSESKLPGFFDNGPAHFDQNLLDDKNYFNTVNALALIAKTSEGYVKATAVRSHKEERQPVVASDVTARSSHGIYRGIMTDFESYRIPILGSDSLDIPHEGYHITDIDPNNPVLVADYMPAPNQESLALDLAFHALTNKMWPERSNTRPNVHNKPLIRFKKEFLDSIVGYWPGPTIVGVSEIGEKDPEVDIETLRHSTDYHHYPREALYEANVMGTIIAAADLSDLTPNEVQQLLATGNEHYDHFDLAPIETFEDAVRNSDVDLITPRFEYRDTYIDGVSLPLYLLACAKGLCLRAAALGLTRHINYVREMFGDEPIDVPAPADTKKLYQMPKRLWLPDR